MKYFVIALLALSASKAYATCPPAPVGTANDPVLQMRLNGDGKSGLGPSNALTSNEEGTLVWDDSNNELVFCDGTSWVKMGNVGTAVETDPQVGSTSYNNWCRGTGSQVTCDQAAPVLKTGSTMTGTLTLSGAPTNANHAATKAYVDSEISSSGGGTTETVIYDGNLATNETPVSLNSIPGYTPQTGDEIYIEATIRRTSLGSSQECELLASNIRLAQMITSGAGLIQSFPNLTPIASHLATFVYFKIEPELGGERYVSVYNANTNNINISSRKLMSSYGDIYVHNIGGTCAGPHDLRLILVR